MEAIANRKEEKDYRDVHSLLQHYSLAELLQFFRERYPNLSPRILTDHLIAAPYIERDLTIMLLEEKPWETVSSEIVQSVAIFYEETIQNRAKMEQNRLEQRLLELKKRK